MTRTIVLDLAVGSILSVADATGIVAAARDTGVTAVRLLDGGPDDVLDPTVVAAHLAGRFPESHWIVDAPTTHNAPYNLARRVLSLDRATAGRSGLALRAGDGDEVSEATAPDRSATARHRRWAEYAGVLTGLWESFPAAALLGDQATGVFAEDTLITSIDHEGRFYRVAGPLDGPSSPQDRPVLVADARDDLDWADVVALADAVVISRARASEVTARLAEAFDRVGRRRGDIAVLGRVELPADDTPAERTAAQLADWVERYGFDGLELAPTGDHDRLLAVVRALVPRLGLSGGATLRAALGLPEPIGAGS
ncbi:LLM class flavin-dependent oxidoreductase [Streptomyces iranensis]|uniref:Alkanesulfonate monooxygenase SsuD/methylene tetrahydromethanopterin reductase-like flavin-dependent oxidoreductase (Luciferase family) n=1 Tax=Streptomyces iranensis TaxID=576784 RepID=A0A060ZD09_9ACTN|nr:LLM class flavin-dependent oxidoreductase [Streptomyces iranensis]MBP2063182.1 alkanesulfonate monooxygenase SsuD/methylene tetrahydromethanopterin reductase-like flavin-dependent oxidoreductase (luciferase family) [Streptomyces iranensis]CDR02123.1 FMN-dependent oxidoreductase, nitrilotriacetatemonooxygenase family [Streptomyces iranensis]